MAPEESTVEYRDVPGWPGYRAGSDGSVWGCRGSIPLGRGFGSRSVLTDTWRRLKVVRRGREKRPGVTLYSEGGPRIFYVHQIILLAFVGSCPPGLQACHNDGDFDNNTPGNLRWDTCKVNNADKRKHGTQPIGEDCVPAKLTEAQVRAIRSEYAALKRGMSKLPNGVLTALAKKYGVSIANVWLIVTRRTWGHVT